MNPPVHILMTVRKPELIAAATFAFRTIRTGFPFNDIYAWGNALEPWPESMAAQAAERVGAKYRNLPWTVHDTWIESLIQHSLEPFWICDTDVVFWHRLPEACVAGAPGSFAFAGRFEPEFNEEWTHTRHMARLHTAVMWIDPSAVRSAMRECIARIPPPWRNFAEFAFIRQHFVPLATHVNSENGKQGRRETLFYDTMAGLWHAVGGRAFDDTENVCFDHLHCGTYSDLVSPHLSCNNLQETHQEIFKTPELARGMFEKQKDYYESRRPEEELTHMIKE